MSIGIGIIGLPLSGKTTVFNALTRGKAGTAGHAPGLAPHIAVAKVPDARLEKLAALFAKPAVPAEVRYADIGASVKSLVRDKGIGGELLNLLSNADCLINVVRAFDNDAVPYPQGSLDIGRDIETMNLELTFSDLAIIERRLERVKVSLKSAKAPERLAMMKELDFMERLKAALEKDIPVRELELTPEELKTTGNYQFLTAKPLLVIVNIGEERQAGQGDLERELNSRYGKKACRVIALCGRLEMELAQLDEGEARELRESYAMTASGADRAIRESYQLLGLISFFTIGASEVRAWSIPAGTPAVRAAGKIHTDMERGFIRAEVIGFEQLATAGSLAEARKKGTLRLEGKDYVVQDGDVMTILFNL
ncbi:MAG: redox-regulated ATPase YchF [Chloroflexi bacterium]|nr:redox-regulated ATPase YchF [Chloroflexota bacterium]